MLDTRTEEPEAPGPEAFDASPASSGGRRWLAGYRPVMALGLLAVVAGIIVASLAFRSGGSGAGATGPVDRLVFVNDDGSRATLADLRGQPLVVNFFASWCIPCKAEMPDIQAVHTAAGGKVRFLGMDADIDEATWRSFVAQTSVTYPTAFQADQSLQSALQISSLPATVFISADGEVVGRYVGRISQQELRNQIRLHLGVDL